MAAVQIGLDAIVDLADEGLIDRRGLAPHRDLQAEAKFVEDTLDEFEAMLDEEIAADPVAFLAAIDAVMAEVALQDGAELVVDPDAMTFN